MRAEHRSYATVRSYTESARMLVNILDGADPLDACTDDLRRYVAHLLQHRSPATSAVRYRLTAAVLRPGRPRQPAPVEDLRKPLKACQGRDSRQLRDMALTRRMPEPGGMHRAEVIGLTVGSIDLDSDVAVVIGKGRGPRAGSPTGHRTGQALTRYLRALPAGLGAAPAGNVHRRSVARPDGALTDDGLGQVLEGPASSRASPASTRPLRHTAADRWLGEYGGNERPAKAGIGDKLLAGLSDHGHGTGSRTK